jgi:hypothetical protein
VSNIGRYLPICDLNFRFGPVRKRHRAALWTYNGTYQFYVPSGLPGARVGCLRKAPQDGRPGGPF